jgi:hypothetical protein
MWNYIFISQYTCTCICFAKTTCLKKLGCMSSAQLQARNSSTQSFCGMSYDHYWRPYSGADPGFQVRGGALKKIAPSGGKHENVWGKITILLQKILFFPIAEGGAKIFGYFVWKITILRQQIIFFPILGRGGRAPGAPPPGSAPAIIIVKYRTTIKALFLLI